jgi:hypothetical protein
MSVRQNILDMSIDDFHKLHFFKLQNTFNKMINETEKRGIYIKNYNKFYSDFVRFIYHNSNKKKS